MNVSRAGLLISVVQPYQHSRKINVSVASSNERSIVSVRSAMTDSKFIFCNVQTFGKGLIRSKEHLGKLCLGFTESHIQLRNRRRHEMHFVRGT